MADLQAQLDELKKKILESKEKDKQKEKENDIKKEQNNEVKNGCQIKVEIKETPPNTDKSTTDPSSMGPKFYAEQFKNQGNEAFKAGQFQHAINMFTQAIAFDPTNAVLYSNRSGAYSSLRLYDKALEDANLAIKFNPDWPKAHMRRGAALHGYRFWEEAIQAYETAFKETPDCDELKTLIETINNDKEKQARRDAGDELKGRAKTEFQKGNYKGAAGFYKKAIEQDPDNPVLYSNRSACYAGMQKYSKAVEDADKAISLAPNWSKAWRRKATALYLAKKYQEAVYAYKKIAQLEPNNKDIEELIVHIQNEQIARSYLKEDVGATKRESFYTSNLAKRAKMMNAVENQPFDMDERW